MIEINLLPVEMRQKEGTPLPRLLSILLGALVAALGAVFAVKYYFVDIPATKEWIKLEEGEKSKATARAEEVNKLEREIAIFKDKVAALKNLEISRIRWARLLHKVSLTVPDGCVVRRMGINPEAAPVAVGAPIGKAYRMSILGYTSGETPEECSRKMRGWVDNIRKEFEIVAEQTPGSVPAVVPAPDSKAGFSKFLGLRFDEPRILNWNIFDGSLPPVRGVPANQKVVLPARGLEFNLAVWFALPPPEQIGN